MAISSGPYELIRFKHIDIKILNMFSKHLISLNFL